MPKTYMHRTSYFIADIRARGLRFDPSGLPSSLRWHVEMLQASEDY